MFAKSFASLVKANNGLFKSTKQSEFLLSKCEGGQYISPGNVYGNNYIITYHCDDKGVTKVVKYTFSNCKTVITWERLEDGKVTVQDAKEIKRIKREIKSRQKLVNDREKNVADYTDMALYARAMQADHEYIRSMQDRLDTMEKSARPL